MWQYYNAYKTEQILEVILHFRIGEEYFIVCIGDSTLSL